MDITLKILYAFLAFCAICLFASIAVRSKSSPGSGSFQTMFALVSALLGIAGGILATPLGKEHEELEPIRSTVGLLISGYFAAKLEPVVASVIKGEKDSEFVFRMIIALASFLIASLATFYARTYSHG